MKPEPFYKKQKYENFVYPIKLNNATPYIIDHTESVEDLNEILDGIIIGGGRDIPPKYYN